MLRFRSAHLRRRPKFHFGTPFFHISCIKKKKARKNKMETASKVCSFAGNADLSAKLVKLVKPEILTS
ncbi:MAG: hypothetical protein GY795_06320 [Desulfobacterales bacterium]|nr:hypothetical protein [Desulfobacterales bacterium]